MFARGCLCFRTRIACIAQPSLSGDRRFDGRPSRGRSVGLAALVRLPVCSAFPRRSVSLCVALCLCGLLSTGRPCILGGQRVPATARVSNVATHLPGVSVSSAPPVCHRRARIGRDRALDLIEERVILCVLRGSTHLARWPHTRAHAATQRAAARACPGCFFQSNHTARMHRSRFATTFVLHQHHASSLELRESPATGWPLCPHRPWAHSTLAQVDLERGGLLVMFQ